MTQSPPKRRPLREESAETLGAVLGLVTHDLRNPLAALSSNVGFLLMSSDTLSVDAREALADVQLSIEALSRIVDSLELVSHDLSTLNGPAKVVLRIGDVLRVVCPAAERAAESHGVQLEVKSSIDEDKINVGEVYFYRSLGALLQNAVTAAPQRSKVRLSVMREAEEVVFRVADDGEALDPGLAEAALCAAGQVEIKTKKAGRYSRGLGLYVVARSAEVAGAHLRVGSSDSGSIIDLVCRSAV